MKVCVTGANGFVGSRLCDALLEKGDEVNGLVRKNSDLQFLKSLPSLNIQVGDITVKKSLKKAFEGCSVVYHVAAFASDWGKWETFRKVNIDAVKNVMEAALACGVKRVVHISSVSVYGFPGGTDIAEDSDQVSRPEVGYGLPT